MDFDPRYWKSHDRGREVREEILKALPSDLDSICTAVKRSPLQVQRHIKKLVEEGKAKRNGKWITFAVLTLLMLPVQAHEVPENFSSKKSYRAQNSKISGGFHDHRPQ